jgi:hypothetical protein
MSLSLFARRDDRIRRDAIADAVDLLHALADGQYGTPHAADPRSTPATRLRRHLRRQRRAAA